MPVGEVFLEAFLEVLFKKLVSELILVFARREGIYKQLNKWSQTLSIIRAGIHDAEEKQLTDNAVKKWLDHLSDFAYDLDDVLDKIEIHALVQQSEGEGERKGKIRKFIRVFKDYTPRAFFFKKKMKSRIEEITNRFEAIERNGNLLNLIKNVRGPSNQSTYRLPSTSVTEPHIYGRDKDKEAVSKLMLGDQEKVSVIPIVGMAGIGKTTLAQLIYNDEVITCGFDLKAWICVSDEFDVFTITKTIMLSITRSSAESKDLNMLKMSLQDLNMLQESLRKEFSKKKFLLVLDDVWNDNYERWELLCRPFHVGLAGSKVLVTTRNDRIARIVGSVPSYRVELLAFNDCLSLLAQHALGKIDFKEHPNLKRIGEALVKKCKGLPLAAKTLGGLLRSEQSPAGWEGVLCSKIWDLPTDNDILPVLRLSYYHLPPHLKHLFSYCSIFPKDYEFDKYELVLLWMGEGFLPQPEGMKTKEELGLEYFNELLSRSFFQHFSSNDSHFLMHDLINDLAQFVAGGACYKLDEKVEANDEYKIPVNARHASFLRHEYEVFRKFKGFYRVKGLRTFLPMPGQNSHVWPPFYLSNTILFEILPKLHSLRVLSLSGYSITELPSSICSLIHLRYLNLSGTSIVSLPDSLSDLYMLETLSIRNCRFICKLPQTIGNLVNLRHLDNSNTDLLSVLPLEICQLRNLQTLPKIVLGRACGLGLKELRNLELLRGTLAILELQNVRDIEDAKEASVRRKQELEELQLTWGKDIDGSHDRRVDEDVLDVLQPHENLKKLKIVFYGGVKFPSWIGNPTFCYLFSISFGGCTECTSLPPLGRLPELKHLRLGDMPKIKSIGVEFFRKGTLDVPFPKLETLRFDHLPVWEEWSCFENELQMQFPCLHQLTIIKCPKLALVSPLSLPVLCELYLVECSMAVLQSLRNLDLLNYLKVESVTGLSHLPRELVQSMAKLEVLECCDCNELLSVWPNEVTLHHLNRLKRLVVADCSLLVSLGEDHQQIPCKLEVLELFGCANLISLPNNIKTMSSLRELIIINCPKLVNFPEHGIPPMLKRLEILSCKALASLPCGISNLERMEIKECSSLRTWSTDNVSMSLKKLSIKNCNQLESISEVTFPSNSRISLENLSIWNWPKFSALLQHVHNFSHLSELYLSHCDGLEYFPKQGLPPSLRTLSVEHCSNLRSLPTQIQSMLCLTSLEVRSCHRLQSFPRCDFPPNLSTLRIWDSRKLKPLSQWGLHRLSSLQEFSLCGGFQELQSLANDNGLLPSSVNKFSIARFPKLISLDGVLENLISLQHLSIMNCTSLNALPSQNLLEKIWRLEISDCPLLKQRCLKDKGDYWPKIAGIPCVEIDGVYIYRQSSD